jgi:hypothetical protein
MSVARLSSNALPMARHVLEQQSACSRPAIPLPRFLCWCVLHFPLVVLRSFLFRMLATLRG